jgi:hypothetical protein
MNRVKIAYRHGGSIADGKQTMGWCCNIVENQRKAEKQIKAEIYGCRLL